jgi:hypothetical protein
MDEVAGAAVVASVEVVVAAVEVEDTEAAQARAAIDLALPEVIVGAHTTLLTMKTMHFASASIRSTLTATRRSGTHPRVPKENNRADHEPIVPFVPFVLIDKNMRNELLVSIWNLALPELLISAKRRKKRNKRPRRMLQRPLPKLNRNPWTRIQLWQVESPKQMMAFCRNTMSACDL